MDGNHASESNKTGGEGYTVTVCTLQNAGNTYLCAVEIEQEGGCAESEDGREASTDDDS